MASISSEAGSNLTPDSRSSTQKNDALPSGDSDQQRRNRRDGRNRGKWRGRGRGGGRKRAASNQDTEQDASAAVNAAPPRQKKPQPPRPTHFLALPLHNYPSLNSRLTAFHNALFRPGDLSEPLFTAKSARNTSSSSSTNKAQTRRPPPKISTLVEGLDTSIAIDPVRMHMTLGVMALDLDEDTPKEGEEANDKMLTGPDIVKDKEDRAASATTLEVGISEDSVVQETTSSLASVYKVKPTTLTTKSHVDVNASQASTSVKTSISQSQFTTSPKPRKTIATALSLLSSLKPAISEILNGSEGVKVPLEVMDVLKSQPMRLPKDKEKKEVSEAEVRDGKEGRVGAGVLFVGPSELKSTAKDEERMKLELVTDLVHKTFRQHGYNTENRPLKLHCSVLNASHRRPPRNRGQPFSYSDILALGPALKILGADATSTHPTYTSKTDNATIIAFRVAGSDPEELAPPSLTNDDEIDATQLPSLDALPDREAANKSRPKKSRAPRSVVVPPPLSINLGTYHVNQIQLWKMGSFGPNGEYVSCGGIELD